MKKKKTVLCPTMIVGGNYGKVLADAYHFAPGELSLSHPVTAATIIDYPAPDTVLGKQYINRLSRPEVAARQQHNDSILKANLRLMLNAGVIIATGTDAGNTGTQHVGSYFNELEAMKQAGFNMWQLLESSTLNAAKAAGREESLGTITKGKEANMVLLNSNPLDSLGNWRKIDWVINKGTAVRPDSVFLPTPELLAQRQLNAYNAHDLEAFLEPYADDVEIYSFPNKLDTKGKEQMRKRYSFLQRSPNLYCKLLNRMVQGNMVIDHEELWGIPGAPFYGIAIYIIENNKISKVYFPK